MQSAPLFRSKLDEGKICFGTGISLAEPVVSEALAADLDFFWMDTEHAPLTPADIRNHLMGMKGTSCASLVRVPWNDPVLMKPILDVGADGIIVPMAKDSGDVAAAVAACRYPPEGVRGFGPLRPLDYGRRDVAEYCNRANQEILVIVQIEQVEALDNIESILAVDGLASVAFGPNDLAASLGYLAQPHHPAVREAMKKVVEQAQKAGIPVGVSIGADPKIAEEMIELGVQWLSLGLDLTLMRKATLELTGQLRQGRST